VSTVFISYRRGDEPFAVEQLEQYLVGALGPNEVFRDTSDIAIGVNFKETMDAALRQHAVLVPVIGRNWAQSRLVDPQDYVRWEIERGFQLHKHVVPVLVGTASWPTEAELPVSMAPLVNLNYLPLRPGRDLPHDLEAILRELTATRPLVLRGAVRGRLGFGNVVIRLDGAEVARGPMFRQLTFGPLTLSPGEHVIEASNGLGGLGRRSEHRFLARQPGEWHIDVDYQRMNGSYSFTLTPPV
jgi:hypothetical protein